VRNYGENGRSRSASIFRNRPIEKVEVVFNIVCDKMRERLRERGGVLPDAPDESERKTRRRRSEAPNAGQEAALDINR